MNMFVIKTNFFSRLFGNMIFILIVIFLAGCEKQNIEIKSQPSPEIALTFDDGPDPVYTSMILLPITAHSM